MSWDQLLEPGVVLRDSPVETDRFGCSIERVTIEPGPADVDRLLAVTQGLSADVLVVRYAAARLDLAGTFGRSPHRHTCGYVDVLGEAGLCRRVPGTVEPRGALRGRAGPPDDVRAGPEDRSGFIQGLCEPIHGESAPGSFRSTSRIRGLGSPLTDRRFEQRSRHVGRRCAYRVRTLEVDAGAGHLEIPLAGLLPAAQGKRLHDILLDGCERVAVARGAQRVVVSTQAHNVRVQRAWAPQGLRPFAATETVPLIDGRPIPGGGTTCRCADAVSLHTGLRIRLPS